jgi:hypothetical protein
MSDEKPADGGTTLAYKVELMRATMGLRLPLYELKVLASIASLLDHKSGLAFPPRSLLAQLTAMDERHVGRAIRSLVAQRLVEVVEPGTPTRAARYRVDASEVMQRHRTTLSGGASTGTAAGPQEARRGRLYGRLSGASTGPAAVPPQAPEEQLRSSVVQTKLEPKLHASRSARTPSPGGRATRETRRVPMKGTAKKPPVVKPSKAALTARAATQLAPTMPISPRSVKVLPPWPLPATQRPVEASAVPPGGAGVTTTPSPSVPIVGRAPPYVPPLDFVPGARVSHGKFGMGTVTAVEDNKVDVRFFNAGDKRVLDRFLTRVP